MDPLVFFNGKFLKKSEVSISPDDRGFLFADGIYEVVRSYHGKLFLLEQHIERLKYSLNEIRIKFKKLPEIEQIAKSLLEKNQLQNEDSAIYIHITRGVFQRMHQFPTEEVEPTIYITASKTRYFPQEINEGVKVITLKDTRWDRCDIKSTALLPNVLAQQKARDANAVEAIFIKNGLVTEGTHTGVFGVKEGKILTHPKNNKVLPSITRELVLKLADKIDISVKEIPIFENQLYSLDEFFIVGTSTEITPVVQINDSKIGMGKPGVITQKLQEVFKKTIDFL
jgi:D-alanine transaminase